MSWDVLSIIGTVAFAASGAFVAMEEAFDLFGVLVMAFVTAFGGGMIRNVLIGLPVSNLWQQNLLFETAFIATLVVLILPSGWIHYWKRFDMIFDAVGLSTFAIQGALYTTNMHYSMGVIVIATVMTGSGGGILRDLLARRKPLVLRDEIYALWAALAGLVIGAGLVTPGESWRLLGLLILIFTLRLLSAIFHWRIPRRSLSLHPSEEPRETDLS